MGLELVTAPSEEPITSAEAKACLRVSSSAEDTLVGTLITAARRFCEFKTNRAFVTQTWRLWLDNFPTTSRMDGEWWDGVREEPISRTLAGKRAIEIPMSPLASIVSISTYDDDDDETVFASSNYIVDGTTTPGRVVLKNGSTWPTGLRAAKGVKVQFTAGYGAAAAVPEDLKQAMKLLIGHWFENREAMLTGSISKEIEFGVMALLGPYRIVRL